MLGKCFFELRMMLYKYFCNYAKSNFRWNGLSVRSEFVCWVAHGLVRRLVWSSARCWLCDTGTLSSCFLVNWVLSCGDTSIANHTYCFVWSPDAFMMLLGYSYCFGIAKVCLLIFCRCWILLMFCCPERFCFWFWQVECWILLMFLPYPG